MPPSPQNKTMTSSLELLGMRWSSFSNWNTVRIPPRCIHWNPKGKGYAPGMRQAPLYSNIRTTLSSMDLVVAARRQVCDDCFPESAAVPQVCGLNLDMARRLIYQDTYAPGVCALYIYIYIYTPGEFILLLCAHLCALYIYMPETT